MKIGFCQYSPKHKDTAHNIATVDKWLSELDPNDLDILMLPEMAFTGYIFSNKEEIAPFIETIEQGGATLNWACKTAQQYHCFIIAGFPLHSNQAWYNAACLVNREGTLVHVYKKHFLYELDETWAKEGPSFQAMDVNELGKVGFGICMDLNPYRFESDFYLCEFAHFHLTKQTKWIFCLMNWLESDPPSASMIPYWIERLRPLDKTDTNVLICNRVGQEQTTLFCGESCVLQFQKTGIQVYQCHKQDEGLFLVDI